MSIVANCNTNLITQQPLRRRLLHFLLLSRPYSYGDNMARALLVCAFAGVASNLQLVSEALVLSLLLWLFLNWSSDARQKNQGRLIPPRWLVWAPMLIALPLVAYRGILPLTMLGFCMATIWVYPWKAIDPRLGIFGPVFRGVQIMAHALFILAYVEPSQIDATAFTRVLFILVILHIGRNLVGDIRDIRTDRYELPARFGYRAAFWVVRASFIVAALVLNFLLPEQKTTIGIPLAAQWAVMETLSHLFARQHPELVGYVGHRLYVITFTVMELLLAHQFGMDAIICWAMAGAMIVLEATYRHVPGKQYPRFSELVSVIQEKSVAPVSPQ